MGFPTQMEIFGEVALAAFLGGLIGLEREAARKPAGLRTHMLVAISACLLVALGNIVVTEFEFPGFVNTDPIRIIEAIIVGISFLGAGTILQREKEERVRGLTTSASILSAATIGIGTALRLYLLVGGITLLILFVNRVLDYVEDWLEERFFTEKGV